MGERNGRVETSRGRSPHGINRAGNGSASAIAIAIFASLQKLLPRHVGHEAGEVGDSEGHADTRFGVRNSGLLVGHLGVPSSNKTEQKQRILILVLVLVLVLVLKKLM